MENIKTFTIIEFFGNLLQNNLIDVNPNRNNQNWIAFEYQEDEMQYPKIILEQGQIDYDSVGADDVLYEEFETTTLYKIIRSRRASSSFNIYIFNDKKTETKVDINSDINRYIKNKTLNFYLRDQVKTVLLENSDKIRELLLSFKIKNITNTFENDSESIFSVISLELEYDDVWVESYSGDKLLSSYSLGIQLVEN